MKNSFLVAGTIVAALTLWSAQAHADIYANAPRPVICHPVYQSDYYDTTHPPCMLFVPRLGLYMAVGIPYDLLFSGNHYYISHKGNWYRSKRFRGPWRLVHHNRLPDIVRTLTWREIRTCLNRQYLGGHARLWLKHHPDGHYETCRHRGQRYDCCDGVHSHIVRRKAPEKKRHNYQLPARKQKVEEKTVRERVEEWKESVTKKDRKTRDREPEKEKIADRKKDHKEKRRSDKANSGSKRLKDKIRNWSGVAQR